jgi:hypothetical protein
MLPKMIVFSAGLSPVIIPGWHYSKSWKEIYSLNEFDGFGQGLIRGITPLRNIKDAAQELLHQCDDASITPRKNAYTMGILSGISLYATIPWALKMMKKIK